MTLGLLNIQANNVESFRLLSYQKRYKSTDSMFSELND